ncbi:hypothetical protein NCAS_0F01260 [Naumovozyma castellii]|uniref:Uncharacterized protein n=1 Tax=Naumovozyma castellii TaxID=27288 RepID=G0VGI9_NAUCA|nr:hypothetical protein NCAS_0F01260 [Naumovozyma castellii CBS 4309]CCC70610.1 hypothetical protein NCAS_0F01260 [Naumovozyma castellii CBS 4309]
MGWHAQTNTLYAGSVNLYGGQVYLWQGDIPSTSMSNKSCNRRSCMFPKRANACIRKLKREMILRQSQRVNKGTLVNSQYSRKRLVNLFLFSKDQVRVSCGTFSKKKPLLQRASTPPQLFFHNCVHTCSISLRRRTYSVQFGQLVTDTTKTMFSLGLSHPGFSLLQIILYPFLSAVS